MNWLQKISQGLAPTYLGVGHNYRWNEDERKYEELWQAKDKGDVIIWYYENGQIKEQEEYGPHWSVGEWSARGRIETGTGRGSIDFETSNEWEQRKVLNALIEKYPGISFGVYGIRGGPYTIQQYWEIIS